MSSARVKIPGIAGKTEAIALQTHNAVVAELDRVMLANRPKPKSVPRRMFAHIRDYRELMK